MNRTRNPFSTFAVKPGAIPFLGRTDQVELALERWRQAGFVGQIVGPHGCGKTCFTFAIEAVLQKVINDAQSDSTAQSHSSFASVRRIIVRPKTKPVSRWSLIRLRKRFGSFSPFDSLSVIGNGSPIDSQPPALLIIDGFERLNGLHRWLLVNYFKRKHHGLLITTHRVQPWLKTVATLEPELATFEQVVDHVLLAVGEDPSTTMISKTDIENAFENCAGDMREAMMQLYDVWESRHQGVVAA